MVPEEKGSLEENKKLVAQLSYTDGKLGSPIDLTMDSVQNIMLPPLRWINFETLPSKMLLSNTGGTIIMSAKYGGARPHLEGGPLDSGYVLAQSHFHWGATNHEGSEHTHRGVSYPMEMHTVFFKTRYLSLASALKYNDGVIIVVYLFKLSERSSAGVRWVADHLDCLVEPHSGVRPPPTPALSLMVPFTKDYVLYWGGLSSAGCAHPVLWFVCRAAMAVSLEDLNKFRKIMNSKREQIEKNFLGASPALSRTVFHVNPSEDAKHLLLAGTIEPPEHIMIVNYNQMPKLDKEEAIKIFSRGDGSNEESEMSFLSDLKACNPLKKNINSHVFCEGGERRHLEKEGRSGNNVGDPLKGNSMTGKAEGSVSVSSLLESIKIKHALERKQVERERENNKISKSHQAKYTDLGALDKVKARKVLSAKNKSLTKVLPCLSRKENEEQINKHQSRKSPKGCLHSAPEKSWTGKTQGLDDASKEKRLEEPEKNDIEDRTNGISKDPLKSIKSRLPISTKSKGIKLQSSIAQYISRPETAPVNATKKCLGMRKKPALKDPSTKLVQSSIPKPALR